MLLQKSWMAQLRAAGRKLYGDVAGMQSITSRQLCSLEISGRAGVHVPTLEQFLRQASLVCSCVFAGIGLKNVPYAILLPHLEPCQGCGLCTAIREHVLCCNGSINPVRQVFGSARRSSKALAS